MANISLTAYARDFISQVITTGDTVIDATAGNGHDSLFLATRVGNKGCVYAFDIQQQAIRNVRKRLDESDQSQQLTLVQDGHQNMKRHIPVSLHGFVKAVMFNLGYLPGADHQLTTQTDTTLQALDVATAMLAPGGLISIIAYPGHPSGKLETQRLKRWASDLPDTKFTVNSINPQSGKAASPVWFGITKL